MSAPLTAVLRHRRADLRWLDRALFALAHQRSGPLRVILSDAGTEAGGSERAELLALHAGLGGFEAVRVLDGGEARDPALEGLRGRVVFLDEADILFPNHLSALVAALDAQPSAPWALAHGRLALVRGSGPAPFIAHKRDLWPPGAGRLGPLIGLLPPGACALLDLARLTGFELDQSPVPLAPPSRALADSLRVLRLAAHAAPALASGPPSFDHLASSLPLRHGAQDALVSAWTSTLKPFLKSVRERARRLANKTLSR